MEAIKRIITKTSVIFLVMGWFAWLPPAVASAVNPLTSIDEARQIIEQARRAGAEQKALDDLRAADSWLAQAQKRYRNTQSLMSIIGTAKMKKAWEEEVIFSATMAQLKGRIAVTKAKNADTMAALKEEQKNLADYRNTLEVMKKKTAEVYQAREAQAKNDQDRTQMEDLKHRTMDLESQKLQELEELQKKTAELAAREERALREAELKKARLTADKEKEITEAALRAKTLEAQRAKEEKERKTGEAKLSEAQLKLAALQTRMQAMEQQKAMLTKAGSIPNVTVKTGDNKIVVTMLVINLFGPANELKAAGKEILTNVGKLLKAYPNNKVILQGHSDSQGKQAINQTISEKRVQKVREYLVAYQNIMPDRITAEGLGSTQPVASNATVEGRSLNRRVEVIILMPNS